VKISGELVLAVLIFGF